MDTSIIRKPLYYGQFVWSQKCQKSYIPYLYNTDTSVNWTLGSVPLVPVLKWFDCMKFLHSFLRRHFAGKPVIASQSVGSFLRLEFTKS